MLMLSNGSRERNRNRPTNKSEINKRRQGVIDSFATTAFHLNYLILILHSLISRFTDALFASSLLVLD